MLSADLLNRRKTHFTLWRPNASGNTPKLVIGTFLAGNPNVVTNRVELPLVTSASTSGLWILDARDTGLADGIYHYWYRVENTHPGRPTGSTVLVTDPFATTVDWQVLSEIPAGFNAFDDPQPASVIRLLNGTLSAVDPGGETSTFSNDPAPDTLPANNRLVIYELPTAWTRVGDTGGRERAVGTFKDVLGLVDENAEGANFAGLAVLQKGHSYLTELGVNALELLPAADSFFRRSWGYDTAHYLAPDWELGFPDGQVASTSNSDLAAVVESCHRHGIRFFIDVVMAFAKNEANQWIDFDDFYLLDAHQTPNDPDAHTSGRADGHQDIRDGFGSTLFRYARPLPNPAYDPIGGGTVQDAPARAMLYSYVTRWMRDFRVDGIRMDSVENVANWDFIQAYKDRAHTLFQERWQAAGLGAGADAHFLVVGEELTLPFALLTQHRLDGLWNEEFLRRLRPAIQGSSKDGESFEQTIRKLVDCRNLGFSDGAQAIIYVTSHDVEGFQKERLFTMLSKAGLQGLEIQKRIKLAFACLLTAVGLPMILAGEEFGDQHDLFDTNGNVTENGGKEVDPVDFTRLEQPFRQDIFQYVSRLVHLRASADALSVNDTEFIYVDFSDNKRVLVWKRGSFNQDPVVVVANFSDFATPNGLTDPLAEYVVPNWPATPPGRHWREVPQQRDVRPDQVGREPIFAWEAKVYTLV